MQLNHQAVAQQLRACIMVLVGQASVQVCAALVQHAQTSR